MSTGANLPLEAVLNARALASEHHAKANLAIEALHISVLLAEEKVAAGTS
jgi:hypothetical protein